jgi:geranylgeranyl diphosphate synthase, type I
VRAGGALGIVVRRPPSDTRRAAILGAMDPMRRAAADGAIDLDVVRGSIDETIARALARAREDARPHATAAVDLVEEIDRLVRAGGRRVRPLLVILGHVAAGGRIVDALPAAAGFELFHTFALIHDDVMDDEDERRGVPATHRRFAKGEPGGEAFGRSVAILVGDLAFALAVDLVLSTPLPAERILPAARRLWAMTLSTAAGQYLDLRGVGAAADVAALKTGAYTAEAPLAIGADLAGASPAVLGALASVARPVGIAFQLLDDAADGSGGPDAREEAVRLLDEAGAVLRTAPIEPAAAGGLGELLARLRREA